MAYDIYNDMNVVTELPGNKILVKGNPTPIDKGVYISQQLQKVSTNKYSSASPASVVNDTSKYTSASPASIPQKPIKPLENIASMRSPTGILGGIAGTTKPKLDLTQNTSTMQPNMSMTPKKPVQVLGKSTSTSGGLIPTVSADYSGMNLFKDEIEAYSKMKEDGLSDEEAHNLIKDRRKDLMGGNTKLGQDESRALLKMQQDGLTADEAVKMLNEYRTNKPAETPAIPEQNLLQKAGSAVINTTLGALGEAGKTVSNIMDFATLGKAGFGEEAKSYEKGLQDTGAGESTTGKIGAGIFQVGSALALPTIGKGLVSSGMKTGAAYGALNPIGQQGSNVTAKDIITGGVLGAGVGAVAAPLLGKVVVPAISKIIGKAGKYGTATIKGGVQGLGKSISRDISKIGQGTAESLTVPLTRTIPEAVVKRDLGFTPSERESIEKITGKTESQYILDKGLAGKGKEELAQYFDKQSNDMYNGINTQLKNIKAEPVKSQKADLALQDIIEQLSSKPKLANAYAKDITRAQELLKKGEYTPLELNNIRRAYDKVNTGMYTAKGEMKSGVENQIDIEVRNGIKNTLEKEAKKYGIDVKEMNKELRTGIVMKDALLRRLSQEERNNFIGLQDLGVSAILSGGEPISAIATIGAKKYAEKVAPGISQKLYNLNKKANVSSRLSRGNTITPISKSSRLGLTNNTRADMVKSSIKTKKSILSEKEKDLMKNPLGKANKK